MGARAAPGWHDRPRRLAIARRRRADPGDDRPRHRQPHRAFLYLRAHRGPPRLPAGQGSIAGAPRIPGRPRADLLLRLPAQYLHPRARGQPRAGRHRLPLHGHLDAGTPHRHLHPHGRRRRAVGRRRPFHRRKAHLRQPRRRHLFPLRADGDPSGGGGEGQHHLQDPVQRRGGDDWRPAARWPARRADHRAPAAGRGRAQYRGRDRRHRTRLRSVRPAPRAYPPPRRTRRDPARAARVGRRHRADLRPDLRCRKASPPQARHLPRPGTSGVHQRGGMRGLWRLRRAVELHVHPAGRDSPRAQAPHRPVVLQQGLLVPQWLLPELRHHRRRTPAQGPGATDRRNRIRRAAAPATAVKRTPLRHPRHRGSAAPA